MSDLLWLDREIKKIIKMLQYPMYIIQQDKNKKCVCVNHLSKEANPACPKCLGTGHKIKIKLIEGYVANHKITATNSASNTESVAGALCYVDSKHKIAKDNIIVSEKDIMVIYRVEPYKSSNNRTVYYKAYCVPKKADAKVFLDNFYKIVNG